MKKNLLLISLSISLSFGFMSCGGSENIPTEPEKPQYEGIHAIVAPSASFAADDGSIALNGNSASNVARLLSHTGHSIIKGMGEMQITDAEYKEIKEFTYIPAAATVIQFLPIHTFGKNFLKDHAHVETIVIQSGTKSLEAYAFENCPRLQKAYIPEETIVDAKAFYGVHPQFQILRGIVKN